MNHSAITLPRTVLITGAAGMIGRCLRNGLHGRYELRLLDVAPQEPARSGETIILADLRDREATVRALEGCDAVVHLAAIPDEAPFDDLLDANVAPTYSVFDGARRTGVRRVVFASTNHVTGYYRADESVSPASPVRPDSHYGVSKLFGEALGRLYAEKHGLEVVCLRIGAFREVRNRGLGAARLPARGQRRAVRRQGCRLARSPAPGRRVHRPGRRARGLAGGGSPS